MNPYDQACRSENQRAAVCANHEDDALDRYLSQKEEREEEHEPNCGCNQCWGIDDKA